MTDVEQRDAHDDITGGVTRRRRGILGILAEAVRPTVRRPATEYDLARDAREDIVMRMPPAIAYRLVA